MKKLLIKPDWIAVSKHSTQISGYGKLNEEQLRILDDVPGSAVELQAKDKVDTSKRDFFIHVKKYWHKFNGYNLLFFFTVLKKAEPSRACH